jgi:nucleoside-diphosphate-sugar epimerase
MAVLVLGGTGFIGRRVVQRLHARGQAVVVVHRGRTAASLPDSVTARRAERAAIDRIRAFVREFEVRVVVDMLALSEGDTTPLCWTGSPEGSDATF